MTDTLTYIGSESIGGTIPGVFAALSVGEGDLRARIDALLSFTPGEVNIGAQLNTALAIVADLQAAISLGIEPPSIAAQIAIVAAILAGLQAQLAVILAFYDICAAAGIDLYAYDGTAAGFGTAVSAATGGGLPSGGTGVSHCNAIVLATSISATFTALSQVFKVS